MRVGERVVEVARKEFDGDSAWIVTVRGVGYRLGEGAAS
ncbi:helix-turn-helix domain-containing protein [Streptomyces sp. NPDC057565]